MVRDAVLEHVVDCRENQPIPERAVEKPREVFILVQGLRKISRQSMQERTHRPGHAGVLLVWQVSVTKAVDLIDHLLDEGVGVFAQGARLP